MSKRRFFLTAMATTALLSCFFLSCSLQRSKKANNIEREYFPETAAEDLSPTEMLEAKQPSFEPKSLTSARPYSLEKFEAEISAPPQAANASQGKTSFQKFFSDAYSLQEGLEFEKAVSAWKDYLSRFVGMPGYDVASYNLALCYFHLQKFDEASETLKQVLSSSRRLELTTDTRILLAESLIATKQYEEGLAATFDVLPDFDNERAVGLYRQKKALGTNARFPDEPQTIRLLTLRGRIYSSLQKSELSEKTLTQARSLLSSLANSELKQALKSHIAWREVESLALSCEQKNPLPHRLSEPELLEYVGSYYKCIDPLIDLMCEVVELADEQVLAQAAEPYRRGFQAPLQILSLLRQNALRPTRVIETMDQREYYEKELTELLKKQVAQVEPKFRYLESCGFKKIW